MQKVIFTVGLPGSGKTTWAKAFIKNYPNFKIVCRDDIRSMVDSELWSFKNEDLISKIQELTIVNVLRNGFSVIVADTNLSEKTRNRIKNFVINECKHDLSDIEFQEESFLEVSIDECIRRDLKRTNSVGSRVIRDMALKYKLTNHKPVVFDYDLPRAYLVDIDGTLALMNGRSPFEWDRVGEDLPNTCVIETIKSLAMSNKIFVMSGRDSVCRDETVEWLNKYQVPFDGLFMRPEGDSRGDDIIKKELYEKHILGQYSVVGVFDDRPRVIRVWKELGLTVFDVAQSEEF